MRFLSRTLLAAIPLALLSACHASDTTGPALGLLAADGVVRYVALEGGFYAIESGGRNYQPLNLPADYDQDGLRVHFVGIVRDEPTIYMVGPVLQLSDIRRR